MQLELRPEAERAGRAASRALPATHLVCDVCGSARPRDERHRLVWEHDLGTPLVLAELCRDCATSSDPLLELHGGRGRAAITLLREARLSRSPRRVRPRGRARGVVYLLIAVACFVLVTLATSRGR